MEAAERREAITRLLERAREPVSAAALAREFSVSRQIIVGDVALLRASGVDITATPRGYLMPGEQGGWCAGWPASTGERPWPGSWRSWWTTAARCWTWW